MPLGHPGRLREAGPLALTLYLAAGASVYMTGPTILLDGGFGLSNCRVAWALQICCYSALSAPGQKGGSVRRIGHGRSSPGTDMPTIGWTGVDSNQHTQTPAALVRREPGLATVDWASSLDTVAGCTLKRRATSAADFWPEPIIWMASWR